MNILQQQPHQKAVFRRSAEEALQRHWLSRTDAIAIQQVME